MAPLRWGKKYKEYLFEQFKNETLKPCEEGKTEYIVLELSKGEHSLIHPFLAKPKGERATTTKSSLTIEQQPVSTLSKTR
jgi:hypothetical protein